MLSNECGLYGITLSQQFPCWIIEIRIQYNTLQKPSEINRAHYMENNKQYKVRLFQVKWSKSSFHVLLTFLTVRSLKIPQQVYMYHCISCITRPNLILFTKQSHLDLHYFYHRMKIFQFMDFELRNVTLTPWYNHNQMRYRCNFNYN